MISQKPLRHKIQSTTKYSNCFAYTYILIKQKSPKLAASAFKQALEINHPEVHWAAILELQALIKISPHLANDFKDIPL